MLHPVTILVAIGAILAYRWWSSEKKRVAAELERARAAKDAVPVELERDDSGVYKPKDDAR